MGVPFFHILARTCDFLNSHSDRYEGEVEGALGDQAVHWHLAHLVVSFKRRGDGSGHTECLAVSDGRTVNCPLHLGGL